MRNLLRIQKDQSQRNNKQVEGLWSPLKKAGMTR